MLEEWNKFFLAGMSDITIALRVKLHFNLVFLAAAINTYGTHDTTLFIQLPREKKFRAIFRFVYFNILK